MKKHQSIIDEKILLDFSDIRGRSLMNHVANSYDIEAAVALAALFCPEFVEDDGCIFISEFYNGNVENLRKYHGSNKEVEKFVNSWTLGHLLRTNDDLDYEVGYIDEFAKAVQYFWQMRLNELFPDRDVVVEIGEDIMGEEGLVVVVYQR